MTEPSAVRASISPPPVHFATVIWSDVNDAFYDLTSHSFPALPSVLDVDVISKSPTSVAPAALAVHGESFEFFGWTAHGESFEFLGAWIGLQAVWLPIDRPKTCSVSLQLLDYVISSSCSCVNASHGSAHYNDCAYISSTLLSMHKLLLLLHLRFFHHYNLSSS